MRIGDAPKELIAKGTSVLEGVNITFGYFSLMPPEDQAGVGHQPR